MLKIHDSASNAFVEKPPKIYSTTAGAWIEAPSAKTYDTTAEAWLERLKSYLEVSLGDGFYNNTGNTIVLASSLIHCEVKPTSKEILLELSLIDDFTNPVFSGSFSFGYSDLCPNVASDFRSHGCVDWKVVGYLNGSEVASEYIASGASYAYGTIFNEPFSKTLSGTFDEIRLVCSIHSFSNYSDYGKANTSLYDFSIDGKEYGAKAQSFTS